MIKYCYLVLSLTVSMQFLIAHHNEEYFGKKLDEKRYEDLLDNDFNKRYLNIFLNPRAHHGASGFVLEQEKEIIWCQNQGSKAFPILLEVLKREPDDRDSDPEFRWEEVERKRHLLTYISNYPEGDFKPFVQEIRIQLPEWSKREISDHDTHTGFIRKALELLSKKGNASDVPLIESFLQDANRNNRHYAEKNLAALKERLAKELDENRKDRVIRGERDNTTSATVNPKDTNPLSLQSDSVEGQKSPILWYILRDCCIVSIKPNKILLLEK